MKISTWRSWLCAVAIGLAAAVPAQAGMVTFEDLTPTLFGGGESVSSDGYTFTSNGVGFSGVDSSAGLAAGAPPANSSGQFLSMYNNDGIRMKGAGAGFYLKAFDVAFIAPVPGLAGVLPGQLFVDLFDLSGLSLGSETFDLPAGMAPGDFPFATLNLANTSALSMAYFYSCAYQSDGSCSSSGLVPGQFALDDIDSIAIPEPGSVALVLTALGLALIRRRSTMV